MSNPTRNLRRASPEKRLADFFIDTALSGCAALFRDFAAAVLSMWKDPGGFAPTRQVRDAIALYNVALQDEEPFADLLGSVYMTLASHGGRSMLGQFFTPAPIAEMMAEMQGLDPRTFPAKRLARICDPACGSGAMLLGAVRVLLRNHGESALNRIHLFGTDLDQICAHMAAVQVVANVNVHRLDLGAVTIAHGDSLRVQIFENVIHASSRRPFAPPLETREALRAIEVEAAEAV